MVAALLHITFGYATPTLVIKLVATRAELCMICGVDGCLGCEIFSLSADATALDNAARLRQKQRCCRGLEEQEVQVLR